MKKIIDSFFSTFSLVSRIAVKRTIKIDYTYTVFFLPIIGLLITTILTVTSLAAGYLVRDAFLIAISILLTQYFLFNIFHFDGLLDSADALLVYANRGKRLEILKDVKIGSFAFFIGAMYLCAKLYVLYRGYLLAAGTNETFADRLVWLIALLAYPISGRAAAAVVPTLLKPARENGLGALLSDSRLSRAIAGILLSFSLLAPVLILSKTLSSDAVRLFLPGLIAVPISFAVTGLAYKKKIGGYTGDALGMAVELGEIIHLTLFIIIAEYVQ